MIDLLRVLCQICQNDLVAKVMAAILFFFEKKFFLISPKYHANIVSTF